MGHFIQERLDRGFANIEWRELYLEVVVHHLARTHSDHCLVLLKLDNPLHQIVLDLSTSNLFGFLIFCSQKLLVTRGRKIGP